MRIKFAPYKEMSRVRKRVNESDAHIRASKICDLVRIQTKEFPIPHLLPTKLTTRGGRDEKLN